MPTNKEIQQKIIKALGEKVKDRQIVCTICGNPNWTVPDYYAVLSVSTNPKHQALGGQILPLIPVSCTNCGNTHFINILLLGFKEEELESLGFGQYG